MTDADIDITALLARWRAGDRDAQNALMNAVYPLLHELARLRLPVGRRSHAERH